MYDVRAGRRSRRTSFSFLKNPSILILKEKETDSRRENKQKFTNTRHYLKKGGPSV
jgi:hypothetical protein